MAVGMQGTSGASGNQISAADTGLLSQMKNFFSGKKDVSLSEDPWADDEAAAAQAKPEAPKPEDFSALFTKKEPTNKPVVVEDPFKSIDRPNLTNAFNNLDFSKGVPSDLITKAMAGDESAFREAMNVAIRASSVEMMTGSNNITAKRVDHALTTQVKEMVAQQLAAAQLQQTVEANPLFSSPAFAPIRDMTVAQIRLNNPDFTAKQVNDSVTSYLTTFAASLPGYGKLPEADKTAMSAARRHAAEEAAQDF